MKRGKSNVAKKRLRAMREHISLRIFINSELMQVTRNGEYLHCHRGTIAPVAMGTGPQEF